MLTIVPDSEGLRRALAEIRGKYPRELRVRRHPEEQRPMLMLRPRTARGEQLARELAERYGRCWWQHGRWRIARAQLRLPL